MDDPVPGLRNEWLLIPLDIRSMTSTATKALGSRAKHADLGLR
jgi:hypothetical protein